MITFERFEEIIHRDADDSVNRFFVVERESPECIGEIRGMIFQGNIENAILNLDKLSPGFMSKLYQRAIHPKFLYKDTDEPVIMRSAFRRADFEEFECGKVVPQIIKSIGGGKHTKVYKKRS